MTPAAALTGLLLASFYVVWKVSRGFRIIEESKRLLENSVEGEPPEGAHPAQPSGSASLGAMPSPSAEFFDWQAEGWFPLHRETA